MAIDDPGDDVGDVGQRFDTAELTDQSLAEGRSLDLLAEKHAEGGRVPRSRAASVAPIRARFRSIVA